MLPFQNMPKNGIDYDGSGAVVGMQKKDPYFDLEKWLSNFAEWYQRKKIDYEKINA
jgi:hypothetical protein